MHGFNGMKNLSRLLQKSLFVIPEVFIGNPVFFKIKDFWIPAFAGMTAKRIPSILLQAALLIKVPRLRLLFFISLLICLFNAPFAYSEQITGSGCSVSNLGYLTELAKDYEKLTGEKVLIRGGGSATGIDDLRTGRVDFAASCRHMTKDDPKDIEFIQVAWDALVAIVHKSNPVSSISLDDIRAIYAGKITNWKQLKGADKAINLFISKPSKGHGLSGVETSVNELIFKGNQPQDIPDATYLASTGIVEQMIEKTAEGFAIAGFLSSRKRDVKILKLNGVYPDKQSISTGKYPYKRPLFILAAKNPRPEVKKFIDFALSKKGQELISSYGAISLSDIK
ncbi:MAG: phosphate ABC transporter substrate-binding protein [Nitrospirae bacterium]|nr:phosphate ABC transporter substrate-binding protein [Nitrospirota bacterium]